MSNPKKYYWLKLFDNFFADPKIKKLRRLAGGDTYIVILLKLMLQTIKNDGIYVYEGIETTLAKELELVLDEDEDHIQAVLIYLDSTKLLVEVEYNNFLLTQVPTMLGSETAAAERKRAQRAREKVKGVTMSQERHTEVTNGHTEIEERRGETEKRREELEERRVRLKELNIRSFLDLKSFMINNRLQSSGEQIIYTYKDNEVSISDNEIPYFRKTGKNLTFSQSDEFFKYMFENLEYVIEKIEEGV